MNLTFNGFLRAYCRELTGLETDNLKRLISRVVNEAPAAAETVMAFAAVQGKAEYAATLARGSWLEEGYGKFLAEYAAFDSVESYLASESAPDRYRKVWRAYLAKRDAVVADRRVSALMREKTRALMGQSGLTVYKLCKALGLNKGNVYAYLNKGDTSKVSRATARRIMEFAEGSAS